MRIWPQLILSFIIIFLINGSVEAKRITSFDKRPACEKSGGVWRQFGNACGDGCLVKFDKFSMCAQALTYACDCLENKCFDGDKCVSMDDYKREYDEIKSKEKELLDNLKEARKDEYERNKQRIMQKLFGSKNPEKPAPTGAEKQQNVPANNNLIPPKRQIQPLDIVIDNPNVNKNVNFKVPPFFEKNQQDAQKSLEEKDKENQDVEEGDSKKEIELPNIPLPI